jgi:FSR family fosmidomycin resistance protein-like MFS transporter
MTYSPTIVMGQTYLPNHVGLASGITLGVAFSIGGMAAPLLGTVADHHGIWYALASLAFIPILVTGTAWTLPGK